MPATSEPDSVLRRPTAETVAVAAAAAETAGTTGEDDRALVSRIAKQDAGALAAFYDRHVDAVYSLAIRIADEPAEAEGVVQEVFAQVWFEASRYVDAGPATARLLLELTRELAIARAHANARSRATDADGPGDTATVRLPEPALGLTNDIAHPEDAERLRAALADLPLLTRLSIELAYFDGLTLAQIARHLEQPKKAVHERIQSGLALLKAATEESAR